MATTAGTLQSRKQDFVRGAIWDAAIDLFAEKGFDHTTVDDIAAAAGVSRRSFFRYFASKSDLMGAGIADFGTALAEAIAATPRTCSQMEAIQRTIRLVAEEASRGARTRKIIQIARDNPSARQAQVSRLAEVEDRVTDAFRARCRRGDDVTPRLLGRLLMGALDVTFLSWFEREGQDIAHSADRVFAALQKVVCGDGPGKRCKGPK